MNKENLNEGKKKIITQKKYIQRSQSKSLELSSPSGTNYRQVCRFSASSRKKNILESQVQGGGREAPFLWTSLTAPSGQKE